jgi:hypothetical protein
MTENGHSRADAERPPNGGGGRGSPDSNGDGHCEEPPALNVRVEPFGPDQARIDQSVRALLAHPRVLELVSPGEHRLLSFALEHEGEAADCTSRGDKQVEACTPHRFIGTVYDYAENRVIEIRGPLYALEPAIPGSVEVRVLGGLGKSGCDTPWWQMVDQPAIDDRSAVPVAVYRRTEDLGRM